MLDFKQTNMPDSLYHLLPFLYVAAGVLTMLMIGNALAVFSGCLLITAGGMVWFMRWKYRQAAGARSMHSRPSPGLIDIVWRPGYSSGSRLIDDQHRSLFTVANRLIDEITTHKPEPAIKEILRELIQDIQAHFRAEEEILEKAAPELAGPHKAVHAGLIKEIGEITNRVVHGMSAARELIGFVIYDVIDKHLTEEDAKFFPRLKENSKQGMS